MDDEDFMREILIETLETLGYRAVPARDGERALRLLMEEENHGTAVRAAILDLTVRDGMGGKETAVSMKEAFPGLPIIAVSGYSEDPVMASPEAYGFAASLRKPYSEGDIARTLWKCLGQKE
jgi:CheY-like chemotaxis protein